MGLKPRSVVATSFWIISGQAPVLAVYNFNIGYALFVPFRESDEDHEIRTRYESLMAKDSTLTDVRNEDGTISLRGMLQDGTLTDWIFIRDLTDSEII